MAEEEKKQSGGRTAKRKSKQPKSPVPLPFEFIACAAQAPERLRAIADDPETPVKMKIDIEQWFIETWLENSDQASGTEEEKSSGTTVVRFEGVLDDWSR